MTRRSALVTASLAWIGFTLLPGCGPRQTPVTDPGIGARKFVGTWIENRDSKYGPGFSPSDDAQSRQLEVKDDGTFKFSMCDASGKPSATDVVEGKWAVNGVIVEFKIEKNALSGDRTADAPTAINELVMASSTPTFKADCIRVASDNGSVWFRRKE